jgi:hypothetical protein
MTAGLRPDLGLMIELPEATWAATVTIHVNSEEDLREWAHEKRAEVEIHRSPDREPLVLARYDESGAQVTLIARARDAA